MTSLIPGKLYRFNSPYSPYREYFYPKYDNKKVKIILNGEIFLIINQIGGVTYNDYSALTSDGEIGYITPCNENWEIINHE